ncbi:MAG: DUF6157 family protein [Bacteroidota bacterium]
MHTTNYFNAFIEVAEDCPAEQAIVPPVRGEKKSIANLQFDMLINHPYEFTSDEIFFKIHALRKEIPQSELAEARQAFFSKGQPCFRASPLPKRYGWGVHSNAEGKVAIYGIDSAEYQQFLQDGSIEKTKAMRSSRKK